MIPLQIVLGFPSQKFAWNQVPRNDENPPAEGFSRSSRTRRLADLRFAKAAKKLRVLVHPDKAHPEMKETGWRGEVERWRGEEGGGGAVGGGRGVAAELRI